MIPAIGDKISFVPTAYISGNGIGSNGTEASKEWLTKSRVTGKVTMIHRRHGWYRVAWKPRFDRVQHECIHFYGGGPKGVQG